MTKKMLIFVIFLIFPLNFSHAQFCTMQYSPVCAEKSVCEAGVCSVVLKTYSNECFARQDAASVVRNGECKDKAKNELNSKNSSTSIEKNIKNKTRYQANFQLDPMCRAWSDGCNTCSREYPGGDPVCTLRACLAEPESKKVKCLAYFDESYEKMKAQRDFEDIKNNIEEFEIYPPVPMEEAREIKALREPKVQKILSNKIETSEYSDNNFNEVIENSDLFDLYPYDNYRVFVNLKEGEIVKNNNLNLEGVINLNADKPWSPFEGRVASVSLKDETGFVLSKKDIVLTYDWLELARKHKPLRFSVNFDLSNLSDGRYFLEFNKMNPSGLKQYDSKFVISFKLSRGIEEINDNKSNNLDLVYDKYKNDAEFVTVRKSGENIIVKMKKRGYLFGFIPISYVELHILDEKDMQVKEIKKPWWSSFVF